MATLLGLFLANPTRAQEPVDAEKDLALSRWKYFAEVTPPHKVPAGAKFGALEVPNDAIAVAKSDLSDLRLTDAAGERIPYVLRILRTSTTQSAIPIKNSFSAGPLANEKAYAESFELAPVPLPGHNEIEIHMPGTDYRRRVQIVGSDSTDFKDAQRLLPDKSYLVRFTAAGHDVVVNRFFYDHKLYRFLRVRVDADPFTDEKTPRIDKVVVYQSEKTDGKYATYPVRIVSTKSFRHQGEMTTAYVLELGPEPTYCEKLSLRVDQPDVGDRPFRLQIADKDQVRDDVAGVEWHWRTEKDGRYVDLTFPDLRAKTLRLVITDYANAPMQFQQVTGVMAVRQVVFDWPNVTKTPPPWKLYFGNPTAQAPRYDLQQRLPTKLTPPPVEVGVGPRHENPGYVPPQRDFAERHRWAIYLTLGTACLALAGLLLALAKQAGGLESRL